MAGGGTTPANTAVESGFTIIREDLEDFVYIISPTETPLITLAGRKGEFENAYHEWPVVTLAAPNANNAVVEGADAVNDAPTAATRLGNYSQLMDKVAQVSSRNELIRGAGSVQRMAKQILYKTKEIKRDMEARACSKIAAVAPGGSTASQTAGVGAFITTNVDRGAGGANPTLSGGTSGYPNAAPTAGTGRAFSGLESNFVTAIQGAWTQGGEPRYAIMGPTPKKEASTFTGNATRFKRAEDKKLVASIDVYESDFGELQLVPDRFTDFTQVYILDPSMIEIGWLQPMRNEPLAKTGHSVRRMVSAEWGLIVGNQAAHAVVADVT
jgi:Family of unknown function (DUF5309)